MACYILLASSVVTMEVYVKWQQRILKRHCSNHYNSTNETLKKTGFFSAFIIVVLIVHLIWKVNSKVDLQNFELAKDVATITIIFVFIPINIIRRNKNMSQYILQHFYNQCLVLIVLQVFTDVLQTFRVRKTSSVKPILVSV